MSNSFLLLYSPQVKILVTICKNLNFSKFKKILLQNRKYWHLTENAFWCISSVVVVLQRPAVAHFKDEFIINNSYHEVEAVRANIKTPDTKISVWIIMIHPLGFWKQIEKMALSFVNTDYLKKFQSVKNWKWTQSRSFKILHFI